MVKKLGGIVLAVAACLIFTPALSALSSGHRGAVTALFHDGEGNIFSAGEDGFLGLWDNDAAQDRIQISRGAILSVAVRPGTTQIAVVERGDSVRGDFGHYHVSAWDYRTKARLFTLHFPDAAPFINYSAAGGFLIVAPGGLNEGVMFIDPETGEVLELHEEISDSVTFAATNISERVMICYTTSGFFLFWDIENGEEIYYFEAPANIRSVALFGGNRFIGGFDDLGLLVLDAASGEILARDTSIRHGSIFLSDSEAAAGFARFYVLSTDEEVADEQQLDEFDDRLAELDEFGKLADGGADAVYHLEINPERGLTILSQLSVPYEAGTARAAIAGNDGSIVLGTAAGILWHVHESGAWAMSAERSRHILYTAVSAQAVAFLCEDGALGFISLDFSLLDDGELVTLQDAGEYTRIAADSAAEEAADAAFLLWHLGAGALPPVLKTLSGNPADGETEADVPLHLPARFPLRAASVSGGSVLFLSTTGALSVFDRKSGAVRFSHSVPAAMDAAFIDEDTVIFARSAAAGSTPFLMINISTGETVPLAFPAAIGTQVYHTSSGGTSHTSSGAVYGIVVNSHAGGDLQTSIIRLDTSAPWQSETLAHYIGDDPYVSMAESGGNFAFTLGDTGASGAVVFHRGKTPDELQPSEEIAAFERGRGLPVHIADGGRWFVVLDGDGAINWHDNQTGSLQAIFRLTPERWVLERNGEVIGGEIFYER
ncbi:MAG: hypothetical protein FWD91_01200 [Treponema sp.]|nr:hypothetical protein [Treponema sp.]